MWCAKGFCVRGIAGERVKVAKATRVYNGSKKRNPVQSIDIIQQIADALEKVCN